MKYSPRVLPLLRDAREFLMSKWGTAEITHQKEGSPVNIVTAVDVQVEQQVKTALEKIFPDISFVGEEQGGNRSANRFWLMDPIDGTQHYVRGLPFCTSMLALVEDGRVMFSAIYDFVNDHMYFAERGSGAYRDTTQLQVSNRSLKESYVAWESNQQKEKNRTMTQHMRERAILFNSVSAGWEFAMVASGKLDARICYEPYGKDYDFAPGSFLVSEAGGIVANIGSSEYDYRNTSLIATNPAIFKELTEGESALFPITK